MQSIVFLMYHELEVPGRPLCQSEPGYRRYVVTASDFRGQMRCIKEIGAQGVSVGEALTFSGQPSVCLTFDDGCETDLLVAVPVLSELGFKATFYVTAGFVGRPGHLCAVQLRELGSKGFEIGCHSLTHPYLPDLDNPGIQREVGESKAKLEQILGRPIHHFSCPGGRYDQRVIEIVREAGYQTLATSRTHANSASTDRLQLGRVPVLRGTGLPIFRNICRGQGLTRMRLMDLTRTAARRVIGNSGYDSLRGFLLRRGKGSNPSSNL
jgi:hypothetical protein